MRPEVISEGFRVYNPKSGSHTQHLGVGYRLCRRAFWSLTRPEVVAELVEPLLYSVRSWCNSRPHMRRLVVVVHACSPLNCWTPLASWASFRSVRGPLSKIQAEGCEVDLWPPHAHMYTSMCTRVHTEKAGSKCRQRSIRTRMPC